MNLNRRWIFTHLLPIFLVVIIVAGITIAAVPSFKNKFVGFISQFGPKADEVKEEGKTWQQCNIPPPPEFSYEKNRWILSGDDESKYPNNPMRKAIGGSLTVSPKVVAVGQNITITASGEGGFNLMSPGYNLYGNKYGQYIEPCAGNCYMNAPTQQVNWTEDGNITTTWILKTLLPSSPSTSLRGWTWANINFFNDINYYVPYYVYWPEVTIETNKSELPYEVWSANFPTIDLSFMPITDEFKSLGEEEKLWLPLTSWHDERFKITRTFGKEKKEATELTSGVGKYSISTNPEKLGKYTIAVQPENTCVSGGKEEFNFQVNALKIDVSASPEKISNSGDESSKISITAKKLTSEEDNGIAWSNKDLEIKFNYSDLDNLEFFLKEPLKDEIGQSFDNFFGEDSVIKTDANGESFFYIRAKSGASISEFGIPTGEVGINVKDKETGLYEGNTTIEIVSEGKLELKTCIVKPNENTSKANTNKNNITLNNIDTINKIFGVKQALAMSIGGIQIPWTSPSPTPTETTAPTGLFAGYDCANDEEVKELSPDNYKDVKAALIYTNISGDTQNNVTVQADFPKVNIDGKIVKFTTNNQSEFKPSKQTDNQAVWKLSGIEPEQTKTILFDLEVVKSADSNENDANKLKIDANYKIGDEKPKKGENWEKPIEELSGEVKIETCTRKFDINDFVKSLAISYANEIISQITTVNKCAQDVAPKVDSNIFEIYDFNPSYKNTSKQTLENLQLTYELPLNLMIVKDSVSGDGVVSLTGTSWKVTWSVDKMEPSEEKNLSLKAYVGFTKDEFLNILYDTKSLSIGNAEKNQKEIDDAINKKLKILSDMDDKLINWQASTEDSVAKQEISALIQLNIDYHAVFFATKFKLDDEFRNYSNKLADDIKTYQDKINSDYLGVADFEQFMNQYYKDISEHYSTMRNIFGEFLRKNKPWQGGLEGSRNRLQLASDGKLSYMNFSDKDKQKSSEVIDQINAVIEATPTNYSVQTYFTLFNESLYKIPTPSDMDLVKKILDQQVKAVMQKVINSDENQSESMIPNYPQKAKAANEETEIIASVDQELSLSYATRPVMSLISVKRNGENVSADDGEFYPGDVLEFAAGFKNVSPPNEKGSEVQLRVKLSDGLELISDNPNDDLIKKYNDLDSGQRVEEKIQVKINDKLDLDIKQFKVTPYVVDDSNLEREGVAMQGDIWRWIEGNIQGVNNHPVPNAYITLVDKDNKDIVQSYGDKDFQLTDDEGNYKLKFNRAKDLLEENKVKIAVYLRDHKRSEDAMLKFLSINSNNPTVTFDRQAMLDSSVFQGYTDTALITKEIKLDNSLTKNLLVSDKTLWDLSLQETPLYFNVTLFGQAQQFTESYYTFNFAKKIIKQNISSSDYNFYPLTVVWGGEFTEFVNQADYLKERDNPKNIGIITLGLEDYNPLKPTVSRNTELHEFGHYIRSIMLIDLKYFDKYPHIDIREDGSPVRDEFFEKYPNLMEGLTIRAPHRGVINDFSDNSVEEGFAHFTSVSIEDIIEKGQGDGSENIMNDSNYLQVANNEILATNDIIYRVDGNSSEESAFASMLWTLWKGWPAHFPELTNTYSFSTILNMLNDNKIVTIDQLYQALDGKNNKTIQNIFRAYGFCKTDIINKWQCKSVNDDNVGSFANLVPFSVAYGEKTIITIPFARPWRHFPPIPDSYIKTNFVENGQEKAGKLVIDIKFDPPYEYNSYSYEIDKLGSGEKIFLSLLGGFYHTKAYVRAEGSPDYFVMNSNDYLKIMGSGLDFNYLASPTFNLDGSTPPTVEEIIAKEAEKNKEEEQKKEEPQPTQTPSATPTTTETSTPDTSAIPAITTPTSTSTPTKDISIPAPVLSLTDKDETGKEIPVADNKYKAGESISVKVDDLADAKSVEVYLDGKKIAESPILSEDFSFKVTPDKNTMIGTHTIKLLADNGKSAEVKIKITENNWFNKNTGIVLLMISLIAAMFCFIIPIIKNNLQHLHFRRE